MKALQEIPLGHKIALTDLKVEETGDQIRPMTSEKWLPTSKPSEHVHIQNLKNKEVVSMSNQKVFAYRRRKRAGWHPQSCGDSAAGRLKQLCL